jgi:SNF2-related domain/SNF2 Helicase protein/Helicase conserved C-terminal domain
MLVLHGWWADGLDGEAELAVWAEDSSQTASKLRTATSPKGRRRNRPIPPPAADHPWAAGHDVLERVSGLSTVVQDFVEIVLPTAGDAPLASPELISDEIAPTRRVEVCQWRVPIIIVEPQLALTLLQSPLPDECAGGADWRILAEVASLADDLAARGRILPAVDVVQSEGGPIGRSEGRAWWRPLITGPDAVWARALALALPPAAIGATNGDRAKARPADTVANALGALTDAAARQRLQRRDQPAPRSSRQPKPARYPGAVREWLSALVDDPWFEASTVSLANLESDLEAWQRDAAGGAARARFRLTEPPEALPVPSQPPTKDRSKPQPKSWTLRFALQAADEPSLVVDAERVWTGQNGALARHVPAPRKALLTELGRAHRLYPGLAPALQTATPDHLDLDTTDAHTFLRDVAPSLAAAGFGVDLPRWWGRRAARLGLRLAAGSPAQPGIVEGSAGLGQNALVDFRWQLAVGDDPLTEEELAALADLQQPLVRLRGQWVELDPGQVKRGLEVIQETPSGKLSVAQLLNLMGRTASGGELGDLPVVGVDAHGWIGDLLSGAADQRLEPIPTPAAFTGTLRPYQQRGLAWLAFLDRVGLGGVLADDMGLGKTVQLLALIAADEEHRNAQGEARAPTLLVCPMSLVGNWQREAARFTPDLRVHVHHGAERSRGSAFEQAVREADLVITTYAIAARDGADLAKVGWRRVVVDEAQAIKNAATKQAVAIRSLPGAHRIAVTGTPVENRLADLWSVVDFANPGLLGSASSFKQHYAVPIERHGDDEAAERLRAVTQAFILRRLKTDRTIISDLPDKIEMDVVCSLTREQASLYQAVVDDMLFKIDNSEGMERRGLVLATMTKLKQVCNHPAHLLRDGSRLGGRSGKLERIEQTLEEVLAAGEKALLFTQFAEFGGLLRGHLAARFGREVLFLHGGVGKAARDEMVARFQSVAPGSPVLFVLSLKAGGTGLTLTAANHVLHVDRWWNPAVEDQATDRAFRIGQTRSVQVRKLVCAGTVEEKVSDMITKKRGLAAKIVGSGEGWLTELSTAELRKLVTLEEGAVVE